MILDVPFILIITSGVVLIMVISFVACFCRYCKKIPRDELMGLSGSVKITNPDALQNNNVPIAISITRTSSDTNVSPSSVPSSNKSTKKLNNNGNNICNSGNATRSLPELPVDATLLKTSVEKEVNSNNFMNDDFTSDTNSDLYATLEEHKVSSRVLPKSNLFSNDSLYTTSSKTNILIVTYERIDENTDEIDGEHPYAQVKNDTSSSSQNLSREELTGLSNDVETLNSNASQVNSIPVVMSITRTASDVNVPSSSLSSCNTSVKRLNITGNSICKPGSATRSLPELPTDVVVSSFPDETAANSGHFVNYDGTGDTNSDLYATLEENNRSASVLTNSKLFSSEPLYKSSDQPDSLIVTYEQIGENTPYNEIEDPGEHPYAQVGNDIHNNIVTSSRREYDSSDRQNVNTTNTNENNTETNIPAASAIVGSIAASNELPYMTPPLHTGHFSGDSQDSTRGYTSITVREPLACIRPQGNFDSHYTMLSDDSDEMYAAIQEAYTSGSETYAQIQPVSSSNLYYSAYSPLTSETNNLQNMEQFDTYSIPHSHEASTSNISNSFTNRNSPQEKRQSNSPLPKPPNINDMYAKVIKKKKNVNGSCNSNKDDVNHSNTDAGRSDIK